MPRTAPMLALACASALGIGAATASSNDESRSAAVTRAKPANMRDSAPTCPIPRRFRAAFAAASDDARLPPSLLAAVADVESHFAPEARSSKGAVGLLQVMPETGRELGLDVSRPHANVLAGARFLRAMLDRFRSADVALAAYNAGPGAVERARGAPTGSVIRYVANVNARWRAHAGCTL
jgi:soluble lytic murein transglycosylase-like protein